MHRLSLTCCFVLGLAATPVLAAPCAGFADVADTDPACASVEWLRNRGITTGCSATQYCPASPVTRAAMALFMNRLGAALTPQLGFVELSLAAVDPDASPVLCPTAVTAATAYPRQALVSAAFAGVSGGDLGFAIRPVVSSDGGTTWQPLGTVSDPRAGRGRRLGQHQRGRRHQRAGRAVDPFRRARRARKRNRRLHAGALPGGSERDERERHDVALRRRVALRRARTRPRSIRDASPASGGTARRLSMLASRPLRRLPAGALAPRGPAPKARSSAKTSKARCPR